MDTPINVILPPLLYPINVIFGSRYPDKCYFGRR